MRMNAGSVDCIQARPLLSPLEEIPLTNALKDNPELSSLKGEPTALAAGSEGVDYHEAKVVQR